ncbi:Hsp20/alpha crystallin family protein [Pelosinus baikalensis]|uniref:Hsp20/alpha crystallin family protein n=1 Tax=Pelosinus baikalensis TaxID=2892015 RepID=A0ABS8I0P5_9FIRM|nr:Hsp20/alpha crystallin family protein [Pelosinus baikalensis]MCC5468158.1 Hsp20/alpha crystallin family protein [Pelosinus baikalensis]
MFSLRPYGQNHGHQKNALSKFARNFLGDDFEALFENVDNFPSSFRVDLRETDNQYVLEADLPGINKEDISLRYDNNYLTISANRNETQEVKSEKDYVRRERRFGQFQRSFYIDNIQEDKIDAKFDHGVLTVTLLKSDNVQAKQGNIPIQ